MGLLSGDDDLDYGLLGLGAVDDVRVQDAQRSREIRTGKRESVALRDDDWQACYTGTCRPGSTGARRW